MPWSPGNLEAELSRLQPSGCEPTAAHPPRAPPDGHLPVTVAPSPPQMETALKGFPPNRLPSKAETQTPTTQASSGKIGPVGRGVNGNGGPGWTAACREGTNTLRHGASPPWAFSEAYRTPMALSRHRACVQARHLYPQSIAPQ